MVFSGRRGGPRLILLLQLSTPEGNASPATSVTNFLFTILMEMECAVNLERATSRDIGMVRHYIIKHIIHEQ